MPHIHDKIDFTVEVFIVHDNKVLLRMHDKYKFWLSVGGHIELDEDPNEAALREVKEEVGLDISLFNDRKIWQGETEDERDIIPSQYLNRHRISETHEHVTFIYFASSNSDKIVIGDIDDKSEDCKWFSKEEIEQLDLKERIKFYALDALEKLKT